MTTNTTTTRTGRASPLKIDLKIYELDSEGFLGILDRVPTTIYALCEPDHMVPVVRYIGKTANASKRLREHLRDSSKKRTHLGNWLRGLQARNENPVLTVLTEVPDDQGGAAEMLYIRLAREGGMDLVNATAGGEGVASPIEEVRYKMGSSNRGKTKSPEVRAKLSAALRGYKSPAFGKSPSAATRKKLRDWQLGSRSPRFGTKLSLQTREKMVAEQKIRWLYRKLPLFSDGGGI